MDYTLPSILISLVITIGVYCIFPLLFSAARRREISAKKYTIICFCVNFLLYVIVFTSADNSSAAPCVLWTIVFSSVGRRILDSKGILHDPNAVTLPELDPAIKPIIIGSDTTSTGSQQNPPESSAYITGGTPTPPKEKLRIRKSMLPVLVAIIGVVLIVAMCTFQFAKYQQEIDRLNSCIVEMESAQASQEKTIDQLQNQISDKEARIRLLNQEKTRLSDKISELESEINFYDRYVVFVNDDGTQLYHKYDCIIFQGSQASFWAYNINAAISEGFDPCFYCTD